MKVSDLMIRDVVTIGPNDLLFDAVRKMNDHNVRHLPVTMDGKLVGIITERDIRLHASSLAEEDEPGGRFTLSLEAWVEEVMTRDPIVASPEANLKQVLDVFLREKVGAIPVVAADKELVGILGYIDLLAILRTKL